LLISRETALKDEPGVADLGGCSPQDVGREKEVRRNKSFKS